MVPRDLSRTSQFYGSEGFQGGRETRASRAVDAISFQSRNSSLELAGIYGILKYTYIYILLAGIYVAKYICIIYYIHTYIYIYIIYIIQMI